MEIAVEKQLEALAALDDIKREYTLLQALRASNTTQLQAARKAHADNKPKSDLKKSTAFVKKLRTISPDGLIGCIRDTESLNLTLYISEIVQAILETNFKATDVPSMVRLCGCLHRRYEDFTRPLVAGLIESLLASESGDKDEIKKKRIQLRFAIELHQDAVITDDEFLSRLLRKITCRTKGAQQSNQQIDLIGLTSFVKYGAETLLGYPSKRLLALCMETSTDPRDYPSRLLVAPAMQNEMRMILDEIWEQLCRDCIDAHRDMVSKEKRCDKDRIIHGSLSESKQVELDNAKRLFEKLHAALSAMSEASGASLPQFRVEKEETDASTGISVWEGDAGGGAGDYGPYEDAESRSFYLDLPDLLSMVPLAALGLTAEQAAALKEQWDSSEQAGEEDDTVDDALLGIGGDGEDTVTKEDDAEADKAAGGEVEDTPHIRVTALLEEKLPDVITKQKTIDFCVSFCYLNSKPARRRLVAALLAVSRNRPELLPNYARIIASLNRLFPLDFAPPILEELQRQFYGSFKSKSQFYIESKVKTVRYVGELIKFKVAPPITAFKMMKLLLSDMTRHNVELLAVMLETCGRYLYLLPATQERMNELLRTMLRLRSVRNLDLHQQSMIEAAYFTVKPPERVALVKKELTTLQKYIRYLLTVRLDQVCAANKSKDSVEELIKCLRRLPWTVKEAHVETDIVRVALKVTRKKYVNIPALADVISGLSSYRPNVLCRLVDTALEEMQHEVDEPHKRVHQRTLGLVKLIGELYNYSAINSAVIFETLHALIKYTRPTLLLNEQTALFAQPAKTNEEPSTEFFRIQLVIELLNTTCGYFISGAGKDKLTRFLALLQRVLLSKPSGLPMHIEFGILDLYDRLEDLARKAAVKKLRKLHPKKSEQDLADTVVGLFFPRYDTLDAVEAYIKEFEQVEDNRKEGEGEEDDKSVVEEEAGGDVETEDEDGEDDDDAEEDTGEVSAAEAARMLEKLRIAEEEDEEFEKAFRSVMQDSLESASSKLGGSKAVDVNMARPAVLPKPKNTFSRFTSAEDDDADVEAPKGVAFKMLSRDPRGRVETRQLVVPEDNQIAMRLARAEAAMREEKQRLKQRVLQLDEVVGAEEDEYDERPMGGPVDTRKVLTGDDRRVVVVPGGRGRGMRFNPRTTEPRPGERANDLNLSAFLAVSSAADVQRIQGRIQQSSGGGRGGSDAAVGGGRGPAAPSTGGIGPYQLYSAPQGGGGGRGRGGSGRGTSYS